MMFRNTTCPRCGGAVPNGETPGAYPGALSRLDNETEICSRCGQLEAMFNFAYPGQTLPPLDQPIRTNTPGMLDEDEDEEV